MTDLNKELQHQTQLLKAIRVKREELQDLEQKLKVVKVNIYNINEGQQGELF